MIRAMVNAMSLVVAANFTKLATKVNVSQKQPDARQPAPWDLPVLSHSNVKAIAVLDINVTWEKPVF